MVVNLPDGSAGDLPPFNAFSNKFCARGGRPALARRPQGPARIDPQQGPREQGEQGDRDREHAQVGRGAQHTRDVLLALALKHLDVRPEVAREARGGRGLRRRSTGSALEHLSTPTRRRSRGRRAETLSARTRRRPRSSARRRAPTSRRRRERRCARDGCGPPAPSRARGRSTSRRARPGSGSGRGWRAGRRLRLPAQEEQRTASA